LISQFRLLADFGRYFSVPKLLLRYVTIIDHQLRNVWLVDDPLKITAKNTKHVLILISANGFNVWLEELCIRLGCRL
jgi:hypothetical protein